MKNSALISIIMLLSAITPAIAHSQEGDDKTRMSQAAVAGMDWCQCGTIVSAEHPQHHEKHRSSENFDFGMCHEGGGPVCFFAKGPDGQPFSAVSFNIKRDKSLATDPTLAHITYEQPCFYPSKGDYEKMDRWYIADPEGAPAGGFRVNVWHGWQ